MVNVIIDGKSYQVKESSTILEACKEIGIDIPTLCYLKDLNEIGACRVCVVEVVGKERLVASCETLVEDGMEILTSSDKVLSARKNTLKLILSEHDKNCDSCVRNENCKLQTLLKEYGLNESGFETKLKADKWEKDFPLIRNENKCIKCMRCVEICDKVQSLGVWDVVNTGSRTTVGVKKGNIKSADCSLCGQCITHCPTGALSARDDTAKVLSALNDKNKITVVQIAPAVRASWGEDFNLSAEFANEKRLVSALKQVGFDYVFDTNFTADLTIMEEANEFIARLPEIKKSKKPMFTSCCPGWIRFIKSEYPELIDNLSTAKSPQQMFGAIVKSYYAEILGVSPEKIFCVSVMPCVAKKDECAMEKMQSSGKADVDVSLTVREMNRLIKSKNIDVNKLTEKEFDKPLGVSTGAGVIFGTTGGVMEAALRTAYCKLEGKTPDFELFENIRGEQGIKTWEVTLKGNKIRVAVVSGLKNTRTLIENVLSGKEQFDFVEVMACPGGCSGGGGQPIHDGEEWAKKRGGVLRKYDENSEIRYSHLNPAVIECYDKFLKNPLSEKSHKLLHVNHKD